MCEMGTQKTGKKPEEIVKIIKMNFIFLNVLTHTTTSIVLLTLTRNKCQCLSLSVMFWLA